MKPDWKDAPPWAKWLAMDADGEWGFFDLEPVLVKGVWNKGRGRWVSAGLSNPDIPIKEQRL